MNQRSKRFRNIAILKALILVLALFMSQMAAPTAKAQSPPKISAENVEVVGQIGGVTAVVAVQDNYAYIGVGPRLVILDISAPSRPVEIGKTAVLPGVVVDIVLTGNIAYVVSIKSDLIEGSLRLIDVSNPTIPSEIGFIETSGEARGVDVVGKVAYVADAHDGLRIFDVSKPTVPTEIGFYETSERVNSVVVVGEVAYVTDNNGLRIIDVSNPTVPKEISVYEMPPGGCPGQGGCTLGAYGVAVAGEIAYVIDGIGLQIIDVSNTADLREIGFYEIPGRADGMAVVGEIAYVTTLHSGLHMIDVSNPFTPIEVGFYDMPGQVHDVEVIGKIAYVPDLYGSGLRIIDVSNPTVPTEIGFYDTPGMSSSLTVVGETAYVTDIYGGGLRLFDVSNPTIPTEIGFIEAPSESFDVTVVGKIAYVNGDDGLHLLDVSNPTAPTEIGFYDIPVWKAVVVGEIAYVTDRDSGLHLIDVSNPATPTQIGFNDAPGSATGIDVVGRIAYVNGDDGLHLFDVSNPAVPTEIGFYDIPGINFDVVVVEEIAYVVNEDGASHRLHLIDVSNPSVPLEIGFYELPGETYFVEVVDEIAYLIGAKSSLRLVDVSNPAIPTEIGFYDTSKWAFGVAVNGDKIYVADGLFGLTILQYTGNSDSGVFEQPTPLASINTPTPEALPTPTTSAITLTQETKETVLGQGDEPVVDESLSEDEEEQRIARTDSSSDWPIAIGVALAAAVIGGGVIVWRYAMQSASQKPSTVNVVCPNCGALMPPGVRFCARCGEKMRS